MFVSCKASQLTEYRGAGDGRQHGTLSILFLHLFKFFSQFHKTRVEINLKCAQTEELPRRQQHTQQRPRRRFPSEAAVGDLGWCRLPSYFGTQNLQKEHIPFVLYTVSCLCTFYRKQRGLSNKTLVTGLTTPRGG